MTYLEYNYAKNLIYFKTINLSFSFIEKMFSIDQFPMSIKKWKMVSEEIFSAKLT